jgi:hypothetical protein
MPRPALAQRLGVSEAEAATVVVPREEAPATGVTGPAAASASPLLPMTAPNGGGNVTKRFLGTPIPSIYECKTRGEERLPCGPRVAIKRCGQSKAWHAVTGR